VLAYYPQEASFQADQAEVIHPSFDPISTAPSYWVYSDGVAADSSTARWISTRKPRSLSYDLHYTETL